MMLPPSIHHINNENVSLTMFSIGLVSVGFWTSLNVCILIIFVKRCRALIYFRNAVLDQLPISIIEKTGTPARYMAITAPERMDSDLG
jgi:hypothetical protein